MLKFLSRIKDTVTGGSRPEKIDARRIYAKLMKQARNPVFFGPDLIADDTDGRMEWLSAHLSVVTKALSKFGADGATLSQAIYDVMVEDFDIALREEGLSDSGVKHRIKPLAKMYLTRLRTYSKVFAGVEGDLVKLIEKHVLSEENHNEAVKLGNYLNDFSGILETLELDQIASSEFDFPEYSA